MMQQTSQPQTSSTPNGFTLVEVIVAVAVVAITTAAAASAILLSQTFAKASVFDQKAVQSITRIHAEAYQLFGDEPAVAEDALSRQVEMEIITTTESFPIIWKRYRIRQAGRNRAAQFAIASTDPNN